MKWLQSWLRTTADSSGPRCNDGTLLREMPFTMKNCDDRSYHNVTENIPGCEIESIPQPAQSVPISNSKIYIYFFKHTI